jgi:hypothetical protein
MSPVGYPAELRTTNSRYVPYRRLLNSDRLCGSPAIGVKAPNRLRMMRLVNVSGIKIA